MPKELVIALYIVLSIIVGILGRKKTIGFWGFFFFSIVLSPLVGLGVLIIAKDREARLA